MNHHKNKHTDHSHNGGNPDPNKIECRAYQLYQERGCLGGHDREDWLQAERELKEQGQVAMSH